MKQYNVTSRIIGLCKQIETLATKYGRDPDEISLLAMSKGHDFSRIKEAYQAGQRAFGENYLQEAEKKIGECQYSDIEWHFTGPLQSNKTRPVATLFDWVHTIDREKIARRLSEQRPQSCAPLKACIQVNICDDPGKSGVAPEKSEALLNNIQELPGLDIQGLMTIPRPSEDPDEQRSYFAGLRKLRDQLSKQTGLSLKTLSMGMSNDMEAAIAEGSTILRIGTAIFGPRKYI